MAEFALGNMEDVLIPPSTGTDEVKEEDIEADTSVSQNDVTDQATLDYVNAFCCQIPRKVLAIVLSMLLIAGSINNGIILTTYMKACRMADTDVFLALWFPTAYWGPIFLLINIFVITFLDKGASLWPTASWTAIWQVGGLIGTGSVSDKVSLTKERYLKILM